MYCRPNNLLKFFDNEPPHDKTNKMAVRPAQTQISQGIRPVWSEQSLCTQWVAKDPSFLHADSKNSDQTGRMARLICLRWAHIPFCWFCHEVAQFVFRKAYIDLKYKNKYEYGTIRSEMKNNSNALANITRRLIGWRQEFATVYSAIYRRRPDVMSNVSCDWLTSWFYVADELSFGAKLCVSDE